jgi:hypothetical protein
MQYATSAQLDKIIPALNEFQKLNLKVAKDVDNDFFRSKYADLASILDVVQKPLADNGLVVVQAPMQDHKLCTTLYHTSGQFMQSVMDCVPTQVLLAKKTQDNDAIFGINPQQNGSAITYARRYMLCAMLSLNVGGDDDDGNAASNNQQQSKPADSKQAAKKSETKPASKASLPGTESERVEQYRAKIVAEPVSTMDQLQKFESAVLKNLQLQSITPDSASHLMRDLIIHASKSMPKDTLAQTLGAKALDMRTKKVLMEADYTEIVTAFEKALNEPAN